MKMTSRLSEELGLGVGYTKATVLKSIASKWRELAIEMGYDYSAIEFVFIKTHRLQHIMIFLDSS